MTPELAYALRVLTWTVTLAVFLNFVQPHLIFVIDEFKRNLRTRRERRHLTREEQALALDPSKYIMAIKTLRARTGLGLKDAKERIDAFKALHVVPDTWER